MISPIVMAIIAIGITSCAAGGRGPSVGTVSKNYAAMAKLNWRGARLEAGRREATPISKAMEGTFTIEGDRATPKCGPESLKQFRFVTERYPAFPFSHYALASCLRQRGDPTWKAHATAAVAILEQTTAIAGHHRNHDQVLAKLRGWMAQGQAR